MLNGKAIQVKAFGYTIILNNKYNSSKGELRGFK